MMLKTILIILSIFTLSFSYAQEWKLIHSNNDYDYHIRQNTQDTAWIKLTINKDSKEMKDVVNEDYLSKQLILFRFNCSEKQIGQLAYTSYKANGDLKESYQLKSYEITMEYALPESMGEAYLNAFCELE